VKKIYVSGPLCEKLSFVSSFHPETLGNEIIYVDMHARKDVIYQQADAI
jgi:hypothetical protein